MDKINHNKKKETELDTFNKIKSLSCQDLNDYKIRFNDSNSVIEQVKRVSETRRSINRLRSDWLDFLYTDTDSYKKLLDNERNILESAEKVVKSEQNKNEYEKNIQGLKEGCLKKYLLTRLPKNSQEKVKDEKFLDIFKMDASQEAVVVSIDIRDSTQLMLNAKKPELFAEFIRDVTAKIFEIIKENYGISDKFTGDGLLCFFPKEYSGDDAIYYALKASAAAHKLFEREYKKHYDKFSVVKADVGLGIGIDSGEVYFTPICQEPTIVGIPVVYACRLSAAPAYHTYLNQPAYELVQQKYRNLYTFENKTISFKDQGPMIAYDVNLNFDAINPQKPNWIDE